MARSDIEFLYSNKSYLVHFFNIEIWNELNSNKLGYSMSNWVI